MGKTQIFLNCAITLKLRRPPAKFCIIAKTTGTAWRAVSSIYQITRSERDILCAAVSRTFNREALVVPPARTASPDVYSHRMPGWRSEHCQENQWSYQIYIHSEENLCKSMSWQQRQQLNQANREAAEARHGARISERYSHKKITTIGSKKNTI